METIVNSIMNSSVTIVIVAIFLWYYVKNKTRIVNAMDSVDQTNINISNCLEEMKKSNQNMEKSLELSQRSMDTQTQKIDKLLERK